jgi:hypothetical protein
MASALDWMEEPECLQKCNISCAYVGILCDSTELSGKRHVHDFKH